MLKTRHRLGLPNELRERRTELHVCFGFAAGCLTFVWMGGLDVGLRYAVAVAFGYAFAAYTWPEPGPCPHIARAARAQDTSERGPLMRELGLTDAQHTEPRSKGPGDLDFIEIGTSSFETLIEKASDSTQGLSVEGLKMYQDKLPDRPGVRKVNVAVSDPEPGQKTIDFYYIHPDDIKAHHLPPWLIGCNAAGQPQSEAARILKNRNLTQLMRVDRVPVLSFEALCEIHEVKSIGYLKVDVEGHEPIILRSMLRACESHPALCPRVVKFEHKHVKGYEQKALIAEMGKQGYTVISYTNGEHRDYVLAQLGPGAIRANVAEDPSIVKSK